jgi:DNA ligase-1
MIRRSVAASAAIANGLPMNLMRRRVLSMLTLPTLVASPAVPAATRSPAQDPLPLLLADVYADHIDPAQCLVSEKYDGVRAFWDGRRFRHRSGRAVAAPRWFIERLPEQALDGELWFARGQFDALSAAVRKERPDDAAWQRVRYLVFELPGAPGSFRERALAIERIVDRHGWAQLEAVPQFVVPDRAALRRRLDETVAAGGEGLMLHQADARYLAGRSDALTKLKPYLDAEATVVGYRRGKGKYAADVGALQLETPRGQRFFIGSGLPDDLRRHPPARGSLVTYRYHDLTDTGLPRFASFVRLHDAL